MSDTPENILFQACRGNQVSQVRHVLLYHQVDINQAHDGWTPLHVSSFKGHDEITQLLLGHPGVHVNIRNGNDSTPLLLSLMNVNLENVKLLLAHVDVDLSMTDSEGCTPLWKAAYHGYLEVVKWMIALQGTQVMLHMKGKEVAVTGTSTVLTTPMEIARQYGHEDVAQLLQEMEVQPRATQDNVKIELGLVGKLNKNNNEHKEHKEPPSSHTFLLCSSL